MEIRRDGRYWAVYDAEDTLVCLTVYKRGAAEVIRRLTTLQADTSGPGQERIAEAASTMTPLPQAKTGRTQRRCRRRARGVGGPRVRHTRHLGTLTIHVEVFVAGEEHAN